MQISSSVSASPMHWNLNSFSDSANFLFAEDKSVKDVTRCVKISPTRIAKVAKPQREHVLRFGNFVVSGSFKTYD